MVEEASEALHNLVACSYHAVFSGSKRPLSCIDIPVQTPPGIHHSMYKDMATAQRIQLEAQSL